MTSVLLLPFFKGKSLESEFGFVNYYHSQPINRLLHTVAIPLLIFGILTMTYSIDYRLSIFFSIFYCAIVGLFNYKIALLYTILFGILFCSTIITCSHNMKSMFSGLFIFFFGLILQGLGHYIFQQYAPAFRLFEAIFTTPVFLMTYLITDHKSPFWNNVQNETNKWKQILDKERKTS
ncbi:hypothetical protein I4U23_002788 [Adineta vaga]|nr:hypothetical protein I4U23_002788 [Adineta vaga]